MMILIMILWSVFLSSIALGQQPEGLTQELWQVHREWTAQDEYLFAKWVDQEVSEDFFLRHNIPTDCADLVYGLRWIYARIEHLPAAATTEKGKLSGNWSTEWKHLPVNKDWHRDKRFRAALLHLFSTTSTRTLRNDTYPIRIASESVTPGTVFFESEDHAGVIAKVFADGSHVHPLLAWDSKLPPKVRQLALKYLVMLKPNATTHMGLLKFRWPVRRNRAWQYLSPEDHPFHSREQYEPGFDHGHESFMQALEKRIDPAEYNAMERIGKLMQTVTRHLSDRADIVQAGYRVCGSAGCPEGSALWERYNTKARDEMITMLMDHLASLMKEVHPHPQLLKQMEAVRIQISPSRSVSLHQMTQNFKWLSPHPGESIETRWGLNTCAMLSQKIRSATDSISFIEKTHRRKNPKYADQAIRQQRNILQGLHGERQKFRCR